MTQDSCVVVFDRNGGVVKVIGPLKSETARMLSEGFAGTVGKAKGDPPSMHPASIALRMEEP